VLRSAGQGVTLSILAGDGGNPCSYCDKHDQKCETSTKRRIKDRSLDAERMAQRLARLESMLQRSVHSSPEAPSQLAQSIATSHSENDMGNAQASSRFTLQSTVYVSTAGHGRPCEPAEATAFSARQDGNIGCFGQTQGMLRGISSPCCNTRRANSSWMTPDRTFTVLFTTKLYRT
jgi:hypothetical protein